MQGSQQDSRATETMPKPRGLMLAVADQLRVLFRKLLVSSDRSSQKWLISPAGLLQRCTGQTWAGHGRKSLGGLSQSTLTSPELQLLEPQLLRSAFHRPAAAGRLSNRAGLLGPQGKGASSIKPSKRLSLLMLRLLHILDPLVQGRYKINDNEQAIVERLQSAASWIPAPLGSLPGTEDYLAC